MPKSFRSGYGIEDKTEQLKKEVKIRPKLNVLDEELEELIKEYYKVSTKDQDKIDSLIDKLLKEHDYKPIQNPKLKLCKYWTKQTLSDKHWVYIKAEEYASRHYFAEVKENKLEEFCKRFEMEERRSFYRKSLPTFFAGALPTFMGVGYKMYSFMNPFSYESISIPIKSVLLCTLIVLSAGFASVVAGGLTHEIVHDINKKRMKKCCDKFVDSWREIEVVRETFK